MNLGIGVCIGDLSFANRTYNTNVVQSAKKLRDKTATDNVTKVYNSATERKQSSGGYQTDLYHPPLISSRQRSFPKRRVLSETLQDDINFDTRYNSRQRSLSGEPFKGEKSENEYSSTPSRASLQKCIPKTIKQPTTEKNENTKNVDGSIRLSSPIATDCRTEEELHSKSKWKLVSEKLRFKQHLLSSSPRNIDYKQNDIDLDHPKKKKSYPTSIAYQSRHYSYDTPATEIRTNPKPIPDTLFDPSIFYITASKFCPCDHHDQLRKIQEDKILLARKARKRSERLKKKELRRKRQAASLSLSRSSSGSHNFGGKRAITVDILPSIPSLTVPLSDSDANENVEEACQQKSLHQNEDSERDGGNNEPNDNSAGREARYKLDTSNLPSSSSFGPTESIRKNRESKLVSRVLESVILDGCESTLDQTNDNHTVSGLDCEETNVNPHRKLSREGGNWTLKSTSSKKYRANSNDPNSDINAISQTYPPHDVKIDISKAEFRPFNASSRPATSQHLSYKTRLSSPQLASCLDLTQNSSNKIQRDGWSSSQNVYPGPSAYKISQNKFYPRSFHYKSQDHNCFPGTLSDFTNFSPVLPYMKNDFDFPQFSQTHDSNNRLLQQYTASPYKRRNSESCATSANDANAQRLRHFSDSSPRTKYPHPATNGNFRDSQVPAHYLNQIQHINHLEQMYEVGNRRRLDSPSVSVSISMSSLSDTSSEASSNESDNEEIQGASNAKSNKKHRPLSTQISHNTYEHGTRALRQSVSNSHPFLVPQLPQCIQNIILQHHWHLTRAPNLPDAKEKHLKKLSKHIMLPDDPEDPAAFTLTPELTRPPRKPWCSSKPIPKIVGTFAFLMTCGIIAAILYVNYSSNIFRPMT